MTIIETEDGISTLASAGVGEVLVGLHHGTTLGIMIHGTIAGTHHLIIIGTVHGTILLGDGEDTGVGTIIGDGDITIGTTLGMEEVITTDLFTIVRDRDQQEDTTTVVTQDLEAIQADQAHALAAMRRQDRVHVLDQV